MQAFSHLLIIPWRRGNANYPSWQERHARSAHSVPSSCVWDSIIQKMPLFRTKLWYLFAVKSVVCLWKKPHQIQKNKWDLKLFQAAANFCGGNSSLIATEVLHKALMFISISPHHPIGMLSYFRCAPHNLKANTDQSLKITFNSFLHLPFMLPQCNWWQPPLQLYTRCACKQHFLPAASENESQL